MSLISKLFGKKSQSANLAKDRLKIILAHERSMDGLAKSNLSWLPQLQQELLSVIGKYTKIDAKDLKVNVDSHDNIDFLEINVTLPDKE